MSRAIGSKYIIELSPKTAEYHKAVKDVLQSGELQQLKAYSHHHSMTRYQHCVNVSYHSFIICRKLGFNAEQAARAGLLHDLYPETPKCDKKHLTTHPETALENARKAFRLSKVEADVILKHMWPIRKGRPKYPESYVVMIADKYVAFMEFCIYIKQTAGATIKNHI